MKPALGIWHLAVSHPRTVLGIQNKSALQCGTLSRGILAELYWSNAKCQVLSAQVYNTLRSPFTIRPTV
jgi:hypothetical protein